MQKKTSNPTLIRFRHSLNPTPSHAHMPTNFRFSRSRNRVAVLLLLALIRIFLEARRIQSPRSLLLWDVPSSVKNGALHYTHQCWSPTGHTATPDAVAREFNHLAIDLNCPAQDDPMDNQDPNSSASDCKTIVSAGLSSTPPLLFIGGGLMELSEGDKVYHLIKDIFVSRVAALGVQVTLVAIQQNCYSGVLAKGRAQAFEVYSQAVQMRGGDNTANMKYAWYATSKEDVSKILSYGFGYSGKPENNGLYGCGVYFAPHDHPLESVKSAPIDEDSLRHLLLCRVILGKSELVSPGSKQSHPSSEQYDSGVDDLSSLRRYIVWSTHVNTHVLPEYIISFRASCCWRGCLTAPEKSLKSTSPWIPFPIMISELSKILPPSHVGLISKYHKDFKERKIPRHEPIQKFRQIAGDRLLNGIFKNLRTKERIMIPLINSCSNSHLCL